MDMVILLVSMLETASILVPGAIAVPVVIVEGSLARGSRLG
jgi:hypothetical protein